MSTTVSSMFSTAFSITSINTSTPVISNPTSEDFDIVRNVRFYALAFIIPCGIVANCTAIAVFLSSRLFRTIPGLYFTCLAIADNVTLLAELALWLNTRTDEGPKFLNFMNTSDAWCKFVYWLKYSGRAWSSWITVSITIERFLCVTFPLKATRWSSRFKTKVVVGTMLLYASALAIYPMWPTNCVGVGIHKGERLCMMLDKRKYDVWNWVFVTIGELYIPSLVVAIFTGVIIFQLAKALSKRSRLTSSNRRRQDMGKQNSMQNSQMKQESTSLLLSKTSKARFWVNHKSVSKSTKSTSRSDLQPTVTLIVVAGSFIIIRLPYTVMFYVINNHNPSEPWSAFYVYSAYSFAGALSVANYAINFFLYCLSGQQYRRHFLRCVRCSNVDTVSAMSRSQYGNNTKMSTIIKTHPSGVSETNAGYIKENIQVEMTAVEPTDL